MRKLWLIIWKELKSIIRDPKIIVAMIIAPLVLTAAVYGFMAVATKQGVEEAVKASGEAAVIDMDHGKWSLNYTRYLEEIGLRVYRTNTSSPIKAYRETGARIIYVIPRGFTRNLTANKTAYIKYYIVFTSLTLTELGLIGTAQRYIESYAENISATIIAVHGADPGFARNPVKPRGGAVISNKVIEAEPGLVAGAVIGASVIIPVVVIVLVSMMIQFASTSMAVEKEEKMLETLLTLPVKRTTIIAAKILVAAAVSLLVSAIYGIVFIAFFASTTSPTPGAAGEQGAVINTVSHTLSITPWAAASLLATLAANMILVLAIGITLSLFAEDIRTAQMINSYAVGPLFILALIPMFYTPPGSLTPYAAIPIANIAAIPKAAILGETTPLIIAPTATTIYAATASMIASRIIGSEKIFTGKLALKLRRHRRRHRKQ